MTIGTGIALAGVWLGAGLMTRHTFTEGEGILIGVLALSATFLIAGLSAL